MEFTYEQRLGKVVYAVLDGATQAHAARANKVDRGALRNRILGFPTRVKANRSMQLFTPDEETFLVKWALFQASLGFAPTHAMFWLYAQRIVLQKGLDYRLRKRWVHRFLKRHPPLKSFKAKAIDLRRLRCTSDETVRTFFQQIDDDIIRNVPPRYWFNADEVGSSMALEGSTMTSNPIAPNWLRKIFLPLTKPEEPEMWRVLVLDGHGSHIDPPFMVACLEKCWLVYEPSNSFHSVQLLDVGPFSVLKRRFKRELEKSCAVTKDNLVRKGDWLRGWSAAREQALTPQMIKSGWAATGLWARNINKPINSRLRRSKAIEEANEAEDAGRVQEPEAGRVETPKAIRQVKGLDSALVREDVNRTGSTKRLLFSKVGTMIDDLNAQVTRLEVENAGLKDDLERMRVKKRRKVEGEPSETFKSMTDEEACTGRA
ncbi:hypothetical protein PG985_008744 [Apiospora marii]|uniref:uncharacterized protein n=1 Tax=Apiospora marii TaxID=335849 RepID=UPI00312FCA71